MDYLPDRWGEKTIFRIEDNTLDEHGLELIIRLKGDPRPVEREKIISFLDNIIKELNGEMTELHGSFRTIKHSASATKPQKKTWTKSHEEKIRKFIQDMRDSLTEKSGKNLARLLSELARQYNI